MKVLSQVSLLLSAFCLCGSGAIAQTWENVSVGSGVPPGIFNISSYDDTVPAGTEISENPRLIISASYSPVLFLNTRDTAGSVNVAQTRALIQNGAAWMLYPEANRGVVFPGFVTRVGTDPQPIASETFLAAGMTGADPLDFVDDAMISFSTPTAWVGLAGSLVDGGISHSNQFNDQVFATSLSLDSQDRLGVAYSKGSESQRGIYYQRFDGSNWLALGNSATVPIAAASASVSNIHPAAGAAGTTAIVAWTYVQNAINETVKVIRFDSTDSTWKGFGTSATTGEGLGRHPRIVSVPGNNSSFYLANENRFSNTLTVMQWNGTQWFDRGDPLTPWGFTKMKTFDEVIRSEPNVANFDIALDSAGRPVVAFRAEYPALSGKYQIFASYRNTSGTWVALGDTGGGASVSNFDYTPSMSGDSYGNYHPTVAIGVDNQPMVAWSFQNGSVATRSVLLRKFNQPVAPITANASKAIALLLGQIQSNAALLDTLDFNNDNAVDAADVERLPK